MDSKDELSELFVSSKFPTDMDNPDEELQTPMFAVDLDQIDGESKARAKVIAEKLSGYFFNPKYIKEHPYVPQKISQEMDNIRRLLKMLSINEKAQDTIIKSIAFQPSKNIYQNLSSLQTTMLSIQRQLDEKTESLEEIFQKMQENCTETFEDKEKEQSDTGELVSRGSREFIALINKKMEEMKEPNKNIDIQTAK